MIHRGKFRGLPFFMMTHVGNLGEVFFPVSFFLEGGFQLLFHNGIGGYII